MIITLIVWAVFGLVVGLIARAVFPGRQSMGLLATMAVGVVGSFVGGILASLIFGGRLFVMHPSGWVGSIVGSLLVLALMAAASRRRIAA